MGWKIYFWFMLILLTVSYIMIFSNTPVILDILDLFFSYIALAGLYAYAFKTKLLTPKFWKLWLVVIILWDITYNIIFTYYFGITQQLSPEMDKVTLIEILASLVTLIPEYIAIYLLAFKSKNLWKKGT